VGGENPAASGDEYPSEGEVQNTLF